MPLLLFFSRINSIFLTAQDNSAISSDLNHSRHRGNAMNIINLEDAKVSYEGQTLSAIDLIGKLQSELREAVSQMAAIAETLGNLQTALLNSHTVEVKLTLSRDDYHKFQTLGGMDDNERIRQAVMNIIHPEKKGSPPISGEPGPATPFVESSPAPLSAEPQTVMVKSSEPTAPLTPEPPAAEQAQQERPIAVETPIKKKLLTKCPTCQSLIDLPETTNDQWPVELKCGNCGSKCLVKPGFRKP
jgi:DNA-directed RNA polymerase subunit RPC12/RpoP